MAVETFEDIVDNFALFDSWEDRYRYVIDLGKAMPPLEDALRSDATKVEGCASQVWLVPELREDGAVPALHFRGDSDAMIVRGLIAILVALISGREVGEIRALDIPAELGRLELAEALSAQRSNGLSAMVQRIEDIAARAA